MIRTLSLLLVAGAMSACAYNGAVAPKGVYLNKCSTHRTVDQTRPTGCMTRAEYRTARRKTLNLRKEAPVIEDRKTDPRLEDRIP